MPNEIHDAIVAGNLDQVNKLISKNPSCLKTRYPQDNELPDVLPIETAAQYGQLKIFALLLEKGSPLINRERIFIRAIERISFPLISLRITTN